MAIIIFFGGERKEVEVDVDLEIYTIRCHFCYNCYIHCRIAKLYGPNKKNQGVQLELKVKEKPILAKKKKEVT